MESILEFMYLGVATFYQERMNEFLNVAKTLEIKEISKDVEFDETDAIKETEISETENEADYPSSSQTALNENNDSNRQLISDLQTQIQKKSGEMFSCNQCHSQFTTKGNLKTHIQSKHEGVKYTCNHCNF